jgi:hypothetical protein
MGDFSKNLGLYLRFSRPNFHIRAYMSFLSVTKEQMATFSSIFVGVQAGYLTLTSSFCRLFQILRVPEILLGACFCRPLGLHFICVRRIPYIGTSFWNLKWCIPTPGGWIIEARALNAFYSGRRDLPASSPEPCRRRLSNALESPDICHDRFTPHVGEVRPRVKSVPSRCPTVHT